MYNELYLEEWIIDKTHDDEDWSGTKFKSFSIKGKGVGTQISLYKKGLLMLQTILGCNEDEFEGKSIIAVNKDFIIKAIGNQGLYIPLYYSDDDSKILSENELCELLGSFNVVRIDKNGEQIIDYEVPAKTLKKV
ncbi:MAG: hypothetical protein IJI58_01860 [Bacilli bacterium]|nr:hypothetical protein [Bacilli bacterium]